MTEDKETMKSFLGMLNPLGMFFSKFPKLSVPLRKIRDVRGWYQPTPWAVQCFQVIQAILGKDIKLPYFSTHEHTTLQTNASIKGLGAVLKQNGVPVYFAPWTLSPTEKKYQNLEHETLGTIWGMEWFSHFLFSEEFTLDTDQKPLVRIYKKKMDAISSKSPSSSIIPWYSGQSRLYISKERTTAMQMLCPECPQCFQGGVS